MLLAPRPFRNDPGRALIFLELGRLMGIKDLPSELAGFEQLMDGYEAEHFGFDPGGRRVADATLRLLTTCYPGAVRRRPSCSPGP